MPNNVAFAVKNTKNLATNKLDLSDSSLHAQFTFFRCKLQHIRTIFVLF